MEQSNLVKNILINLSLLLSSTMFMLWIYSSDIHTNIGHPHIKSLVDLWTEVGSIFLSASMAILRQNLVPTPVPHSNHNLFTQQF